MVVKNNEIFGLIKPSLDAHTLGINAVAELLRECGYQVAIGNEEIQKAFDGYKHPANREKLMEWVVDQGITRLSFSYRLDPDQAFTMVSYLMHHLKDSESFVFQDGPIEKVYFAGLPAACVKIKNEFQDLVETFQGSESITETLRKFDIPDDRIPQELLQANKYDESLAKFAKEIMKNADYLQFKPLDRSNYPQYGSFQDSLVHRINHIRQFSNAPLMRVHAGPYSPNRIEAIQLFMDWSKQLAKANYLDILSIGSSQLTQSHFNMDWTDLPNGGGVPIQNEAELQMIYEASRPMLVRSYSGTRDVVGMAEVFEKRINMAWHALSFWWFCQTDGRGPNDLYSNLKQHISTVHYIASIQKPFEANVPHHFAFRGADDVTYIVSGYLSAKIAKQLGIKTFVLQNMLNTPRYTSGVADLAKSRALVTLVRSLEDANFKVILQPRAGLDYFSPDLDKAKIQLATVSAMMDDIEPDKQSSPEVIHVVSYSEASHLATPEIINESIQITQFALSQYRLRKSVGQADQSFRAEVVDRSKTLIEEAQHIISAIENNIEDPYSAEGFYLIFAAGFLPVPYLWGNRQQFPHAVFWKTKLYQGGVVVIDEHKKPVSSRLVAQRAISSLVDAQMQLQWLKMPSQ